MKGMVHKMSNRFGAALVVLVVLATGLACRHSVGQVTAEEPVSCPVVTVAPDTSRLLQLLDEIRLLGMLNRLQLSAEQIERLLPVTEKLQQERAAAQAEIAALQTDLEKVLQQKRDLLVADKPVPADLDKQIGALQNRQQAAQEQATARLGQSAKAIRALLSPQQADIATGRYEARLQAQELLEWLRGLSDSDFTEEANSNAQGLADPDKGFSAEALVKMFQTVRKLSAAEFDKQREAYAQKLAPLYGSSEDEENQQIAGAFSHPQMADLLREKLKVAGGGAG